MTHLEEELISLKKSVIKMCELAIGQLKKAKMAYLNWDVGLAHDIIHNEKRMNAMELGIDEDCENIFALFNPVATDLRLVIAILKINSDLERIGDYADGIADYVIDFHRAPGEELIKNTKLSEMFDIAIGMTEDIMVAIENEDLNLARKVYLMDAELNKINVNSSIAISEMVLKNPELIRQALFIFSTIRKIERVGDHVKNIAEDLIFYAEAEVLKHTDKLE